MEDAGRKNDEEEWKMNGGCMNDFDFDFLRYPLAKVLSPVRGAVPSYSRKGAFLKTSSLPTRFPAPRLRRSFLTGAGTGSEWMRKEGWMDG